jgi:putative nucleotidyltransferase with HDIG domain
MDNLSVDKKYLIEKSGIIKKIDRIDELFTLPAIAMEVNKMLQDLDTSTKKLGDIIEKDQAIVSKILRLVNSAFFGLPSKVNNIPHALMVLGFNTVRNAVISISVMDALALKNIPEGFEMKDFWKHSIAVAVTSKRLAEKTKLCPPDDCFIGGLLHDIGKIIIAQSFRDIFIIILTMIRDKDCSFSDAEKEIIPMGHDEIGGHLAKKWKLPHDMVDAIKYHHSNSAKVNNLNFLLTIHAADYVVNHFSPDSEKDFMTAGMGKDAETLMQSQFETIKEWYPEVMTEIDSTCDFFLREIKG